MNQKDQEFENYLQQIEDPNYQGGSYDLPNNASPLEQAKFELCQKILKENNHLSTKEIAKKIQLSEAETEDILHCRIDKFTLDRLVFYTGKLSSKLELRVI